MGDGMSWKLTLSNDTLTEFYIKMADVPAQAILNEAALKRFDPYVKEILDTAKFVALYSFNPTENEWEKTNVEGSLFVYSRTGEPFYNILVLNRLNTTNLIEPISHKWDLQLHEPFLLYRNTKFSIYGIWFYEKDECTRLATLLQELMKKLGGSKRTPTSVTANGGANVDIYSMLSKAQEVYNSSKSSTESKNIHNNVSLPEVEQTPQSVMDFFAKAGSAPQKTSVPTGGASRLVLGRSQSITAPENSDKTPLNPLIHQLMSDPVHSVEHIEKQQRSVTPQTNDTTNSQLLKKMIRPSSGQFVDFESQSNVEDSLKKNTRLENGLNGFNFIRISSPSFRSMLSQPVADSTEFRSLSTPKTPSETPQKPALMPPAMFTPSVAKEPLANESGFSFKDNDLTEPALLTKSQLLQALNYLLKNDPEFVSKIHEAYVKSLTDKVL